MLLVFDDKHKADLEFLKTTNVSIITEFCKIAVNFIKSGANKKLFAGAAQALDVDVETVEHCVEGLAHLFTESAKTRITEIDFLDSLMLLSFPQELTEKLKEFYFGNHVEIRRVIAELSFSIPHYQSLEWRLDIQVGSRTEHRQMKSVYTLQLETMSAEPEVETLQADYSNLKHLCTELELALREAQAAQTRRIMRNIK